MNSDCLFSVNMRIVGKDANGLKYHNDEFRNVLDTLMPGHILDVCAWHGLATSAVLKQDGNRARGNVAGVRVAQLDFDNTWTVTEAIDHPFYLDYGIGLYTTPSHGLVQDALSDGKAETMDDQQAAVIRGRVGEPMTRFRLVFVLEELLPAEHVQDFYCGLFALFPMADTSCKDAARLFFGCRDAEIRIDNSAARRIEPAQVSALIAVGQQQRNRQALIRPASVVSAPSVGGRSRVSSRSNVEWVRQDVQVVLANGEVTSCRDLQTRMRTGYENRLSCFSPFRNERSPSAFVTMDETRRLFFYDSAACKAYAFA